jgi:hypothetical protein
LAPEYKAAVRQLMGAEQGQAFQAGPLAFDGRAALDKVNVLDATMSDAPAVQLRGTITPRGKAAGMERRSG